MRIAELHSPVVANKPPQKKKKKTEQRFIKRTPVKAQTMEKLCGEHDFFHYFFCLNWNGVHLCEKLNARWL